MPLCNFKYLLNQIRQKNKINFEFLCIFLHYFNTNSVYSKAYIQSVIAYSKLDSHRQLFQFLALNYCRLYILICLSQHFK